MGDYLDRLSGEDAAGDVPASLAYAEPTGSCATSTPTSRCPSSRDAVPSMAAHRSRSSPSAASSARARAWFTGSTWPTTTSPCSPPARVSSNRWEPRRRGPSQRCAGATRACVSRSGATRRSYRSVRGEARARDARPARGPDAIRAARAPREHRRRRRRDDRGRLRPPGPARGRARRPALRDRTCASAAVVAGRPR